MKHFERAPGGYTKADGSHVDIIEHFTVELWEQPFWPWLVANVYHWYDMRIYKVPGFKVAEWIWDKVHRHKINSLEYLPLTAEQDCKCYYLINKKRKILAKYKAASDSEVVKASWG